MDIDLCKDFSVKTTAEGICVVTPFSYDDGDAIVVFVRPQGDEEYVIDDNGEAATRLMFEGLDLEVGTIQSWLFNLSRLHGIDWNKDSESLSTVCKKPLLERRILAIAEASAQMQALASLRRDYQKSNFKQAIINILQEIQLETRIEAKYNIPVDSAKQLFADAYFLSTPPLIIIAANNAERLLEAELIWSNARRENDPSFVLAVVETTASVGARQFQRANYYTDKTVELSGMPDAFRLLVSKRITTRN